MKITIINWSDRFENSNTRKRQRLGWFLAPTGCDSKGYRQLMREGSHGVVALGVFQALCQVMGTLEKSTRKIGFLANSDGSGMEVADLWEITRIKVVDLERSLQLLEKVKWLSIDTEDVKEESATSVPPPCHPSATSVPKNSCFVKGEGEGEGEGEEEDIGSASCLATPDVLAEIWKMVPQVSRTRSSHVKVKKAWGKIKVADRPSLETLTDALASWNLTEKWQEGFAEGLHIWINDRQWENIPQSESSMSPTGTRDIQFGGRSGTVTKIES